MVRGRTLKKGAVPFKDQLAGKPPELLACRFYRKHADEDFNVIASRRGYRKVHCRCARCGRITVWEVRLRDGQRELLSVGAVDDYAFVGIGQRIAAERGAIDAKYVSSLDAKYGITEP
jgi:hypothetical protein